MYQEIKPLFEGKPETCIKRVADNAFIPFDIQNVDYAEYLKWLAEGNEPMPAEIPNA